MAKLAKLVAIVASAGLAFAMDHTSVQRRVCTFMSLSSLLCVILRGLFITPSYHCNRSSFVLLALHAQGQFCVRTYVVCDT